MSIKPIPNIESKNKKVEEALVVKISKIKVSVILPVYNVEKYLRQCLDSIINQTLRDIEIICIDDGSTDNSYKILHEYSLKDARIHVLHQENKGAGAARNRGLRVANGEYLSFLDSDDYFAPTMLEEMYKCAKANDNDIVICRSKSYNQQTKKEEVAKWTIKESQLPKKEVFSCYDNKDHAFTYAVGWAWDKLYKATFIRIHEIKFQEIRTSNDAFFVFTANVKARRISVVNKEFAIHRIKTNTSLAQTRELSWDCFYKALTSIKAELIDYGVYSHFEKGFVRWALHFCLWNINTIAPKSQQKMHSFLRKRVFKELELKNYPKEYFNDKEYEQFLRIVKLPFANHAILNSLYAIATWPFRMVRNFLICWHNNGFTYTIQRVKAKLKFVKSKLLPPKEKS